jgi:hypothetical protein
MNKTSKTTLVIFFLLTTGMCFASDTLETVWEKIYRCDKSYNSISQYFYFEIDTVSNDKLNFFAQVGTPNPSDIVIDHSGFYLTRIDMNTGDFIGGMTSAYFPRSMSPRCIDFYNDTLTIFNWYGYTSVLSMSSAFELRIVKAIYNNDGVKLIPAYSDNDTLFTDTANPKGWLYANRDSIGTFNFDRKTGTLKMSIIRNKRFAIYNVNYIDTLYKSKIVDYINLFRYMDNPYFQGVFDINVDTTGLILGNVFEKVIDNKNYAIGIAYTEDAQGWLQDVPGVFVATYDNAGMFTSVKIIEELQNKVMYDNIYFADGHIYIEGFYYTGILPSVSVKKRIIRIMTLEGDILSEREFNYPASPLLKKHTNKDLIGVRTMITPNNDIILSGFTQNNGNAGTGTPAEPASFYIAKYNKDLQLMYEKEWKCDSDFAGENVSCSIQKIQLKDGYVYISGFFSVGENDATVEPPTFANAHLYFAKFREPEVGINEPSALSYSKLYPNPTTSNSTITLELAEAAQVHISLNDMLGREIKQIYNAFTDAGTFTHSFATQDLPKGIYYLKIFIGGEVKVEKVVVN